MWKRLKTTAVEVRERTERDRHTQTHTYSMANFLQWRGRVLVGQIGRTILHFRKEAPKFDSVFLLGHS